MKKLKKRKQKLRKEEKECGIKRNE